MIKVRLKKFFSVREGRPRGLDVAFEIRKGELATLFGNSGAGKTSILRMIAGLLQPKEGEIEVNGEVWFNSKKRINLPVQKRNIGFVFQDYNLFPHMNVEENLKFALLKKDSVSMIEDFLRLVEMSEAKMKMPHELSGGERQRIALVRALLRRPKIFLLDEPLAALDTDMRSRLQDEIIKVYNRYEVTTLLVTHDLAEAYRLSQNVLIIEDGRIIRQGEPDGVLAHARLSDKFKFTGQLLSVIKDCGVYVLKVQVGSNIVKVVATETEAEGLKAGDQVLVAAKAFNPVVMKLEG